MLNDKLDIFEIEQLDKKKIEMYENTKQKTLALTECLETQFISNPHKIGCIPGVSGIQQQKFAFNCWINKYKQDIKNDTAIKNNGMDLFIEQLKVLQTSAVSWDIFFTKWQLNRILHDDNFETTWKCVKLYLNVSDVDFDDFEDDDIKEEEKQEVYISRGNDKEEQD